MAILAKERATAAEQHGTRASRVLRSTNATIIAKDVISEGPIYGLVNGPASVFLDAQPLMDQSLIPFHGSKTATRLSVTNGSKNATLINANSDLLKRLRANENDVDFVAIRGGQGSIACSVIVQDDDERGLMKATGASGSFAPSMVTTWHGYSTGGQVIIPARVKGVAYTNYRDIEITIISLSGSTEILFKLGTADDQSTAGITLPEGDYTIEVDAIIDIEKVTSVDSSVLVPGQLAEVQWVEEYKRTPRQSVYWEEMSTRGYAARGFDVFGPPFINEGDIVGDKTRRRKYAYSLVSSISLGYIKNHNHYCYFGYFKPPSNGRYEFQLTSDDGAGMWLGPIASTTYEENEQKSTLNKKSALVDVALGGKTSERTESAISQTLDSTKYYPIRLVHYNNHGPGKFRFEWRKAGSGAAFSTSLATHFYYPQTASAKDRNFIDLNNITLTQNWTGDTGEYPIDLGASPSSEVESSADVVQTTIQGGSVGFRVGDLLQSPIPNPTAYKGSTQYSGNAEAITRTPKPGTDLKQHVDFIEPEYSPHDGVQTTVIQGTAEKGMNLTAEQIANVDSFRLSIQYPNGIGQVNGDGNLKRSLAVYRISIKFRNVGETAFESTEYVLEEDLAHKYSGKDNKGTKNALTFDHTIEIGKFAPFADFQILIKRKTAESGSRGYSYDGDAWKNGLQHKHTMQSEAVIGPCTAIIHQALRYPYTAYAKTTYSTLSFKDLPKRTYHCKGLLVKVPTNYVTRDEAPGGVASYTRNITTGAIETAYQDWDGNLRNEPVYTNNPAWVFYDIITNNRYGLGDFMSASDIDIFALYRIARYCDELVDTGIRPGDKEPRFTCNVYLTKQADAYKVLKDLCTCFRSMLYWFDGQVVPVLDQAQEPVYNFSKANVVNGAFSYESTGSKTRANQVVVSWNNPANNYQVEGLLCEDKENIIKTGRVILEKAHAFGCTSESQAKRYGRWKLWTGINQTEIVSFETALNARFLVPGDIVNIQDTDRSTSRYGGRVSNTGTLSTTVIPLDDNVTLKAGHTYRLSIIFVKPAAFLAQETASIHTTLIGDGSPQTFNEGDLITHAWFYNTSSLQWERLEIDSESKVTNARESSTTTESLLLSWAPHTRIETKEVSTGAGTTSSITVSSAFSTLPEKEAIWVLEELDSDNIKTEESANEYKIMSIEEKENGSFSISAARHYNAKFSSIEDDTLKISSEQTPEEPLPRELFLPPISAAAMEYVD